ncbi:hypothetical protein ACFP1Z_18360 [Streptomyces gamaensis]|uniref:Uncharacterized protein n=1 Tax=Streptomyces gamaensis TaxID=1763542 RepID=A0ABW0Z4A6_9ACTN
MGNDETGVDEEADEAGAEGEDAGADGVEDADDAEDEAGVDEAEDEAGVDEAEGVDDADGEGEACVGAEGDGASAGVRGACGVGAGGVRVCVEPGFTSGARPPWVRPACCAQFCQVPVPVSARIFWATAICC